MPSEDLEKELRKKTQQTATQLTARARAVSSGTQPPAPAVVAPVEARGVIA